jgi:hypothetical protein
MRSRTERTSRRAIKEHQNNHALSAQSSSLKREFSIDLPHPAGDADRVEDRFRIGTPVGR